MRTKVINLFGAPGVGKSTLAADLYVQMKRAGYSVEMVREVAKDWAWQGREIGLFDQMAIIGEQMKRESILYNNVNYIITDSPIALGAYYLEYNHGEQFMSEMVDKFYRIAATKGISYQNWVIPPGKVYDENGRFESKEESINISTDLYEYLDERYFDFEIKIPKLEDIV